MKTTFDYSKPARTRMAPSPTGEIQIGNLRTLLYDYALARRTGGKFILRIEDTDQKRYVEGAEERIYQVLRDYGLMYDEGPDIGGPYAPYRQTERLEHGLYQKFYDKLLEEGKVYRCFCTEDATLTKEEIKERREKAKKEGRNPMYSKKCRNLTPDEINANLSAGKSFVIRIKMPVNEDIIYNDPIRGTMKWNSSDVDDYILVKSNGIPTYHGAIAIDDMLMNITHVIRGMDWIPTTPVYITFAKYIGFEMPILLHVSDLMNEDPNIKGKLSKRRSGEKVFARYQLEIGYPPEAVLNYLMFLGWSHPDEKVNILSLEEFCNVFSIERLQPQSPRINFEKLEWYGGQYIRKMTNEELIENVEKWIVGVFGEKPELWNNRLLQDKNKFTKILSLLKERMRKYSDIFEQGEFFYTRPSQENIIWEKTNHTKEECVNIITELKSGLQNAVVDNNWTQENWEKVMRDLAEKYSWKAGDMFMLLRLMIIGSPFSPNLLESMNVLGVEESLERINI